MTKNYEQLSADNEEATVNHSPEENAFFLSRWTHTWGQKLLFIGYKRPLEVEDLWELPPQLRADNKQQQDYPSTIDWTVKSPVLKSLVKYYLLKYWTIFILKFWLIFLTCINPLILRALLQAVGSPIQSEHFYGNMWFLAILFFVGKSVQSSTIQYQYWATMKMGLAARAACMTEVYKKAVRMSIKGKREGNLSAGSVVNLMAVDADAVLNAFWDHIHDSWSAPFSIILLIIILCFVVGPSGLVGFFIMVAVMPLNAHIGKAINHIRERALEHSDNRVKLLMEILQGIRLLKLYAWEKPFGERVNAIRKMHEAFNYKFQTYGWWSVFVNAMLPGVVLTATFTTYIMLGHTLTPEVAFTALALFVSMREPLLRISWALQGGTQFLVSMKHIEDFLTVNEVDEQLQDGASKNNNDNGIVIKNADFWWSDDVKRVKTAKVEKEKAKLLDNEEDSSQVGPALDGINFIAPAGKLTCVVGPVGCGKSTLLHALLREISPRNGDASVPTNVGYTPQTPWLITATLKQNILFGDTLNEERYKKVVEACALLKDLEVLPGGDGTEIGEQGINLSGGQKQRISLARALYHNASCYILDEPLSAVDAHVATWLFDKCINGMMADKTRVLVTHQLQFLPKADHIIVMDHGKITHSGTYQELLDQGIDFQTLVKEKFQDIEDKTQKQESKEKEEEHSEVVVQSPASPSVVRAKTDGKLISAEERQLGQVGLGIYKEYFKSAGSLSLLVGLVGLYFISQVVLIGCDYWLALWSNDTLKLKPLVYVYIYLGINIGFGILRRIAMIFVQMITCRSANNLHFKLLNSILGARVSFFDTTPAGRIINRFSKDQSTLDTIIPNVLQDCCECAAIVICGLAFICIVTPLFTIPLAVLVVLYYFIQKFYRRTSRELKRMESISRSPMFSHFSESFNGTTCIRAFHKQKLFISQMNEKIDNNTKMYYNSFCVNRWLGWRLEMIGSLFVLFAAIFALLAKDSLEDGMVGFVLSCSLSLATFLNWAVRQFAEIEVNMNAVERLLHYVNNIPQEEPKSNPKELSSSLPPMHHPLTVLSKTDKLDDNWPAKGVVQISDLVIKYREDLDPVLRGISCELNGGEKIGIVGRTGAGKSTLTTALFRLVEPAAGKIVIDDVDISTIDLTTLRSRLSIIPQDPVLFSGSIKTNLDPFLKHDDKELWEVLDQVHLKNYVEKLPLKLDNEVIENGEGFSVGQRQLLCLGRALLRKTRILVMDEATASLDFKTDMLIKQTIKECFADKTLIIIAHRLDTILDSNKIIVFEQGKIAEMDSPDALINQPTSKFAALVQAAKQSAHG